MTDKLQKTLEDPERLAALERLALLDTPTEAAFDRLTQLAHKILKAPVSLISLIDVKRQFFKSAVGLGEPWASLRENPISYSFCKHMLPTGEPLIIEDAREHPLVCDNPAVSELDVIAYAGIPLITPEGQAVGSFCVLDHESRQWTEEEIAILRDLAASVMSEINLRHELVERQRVQEALRKTEDRYRSLFERSLDAVFIHDFHGQCIDANQAALDMLGYSRSDIPELNFVNLLSRKELPKARAMLREVQAKGFQESRSEFHIRTKDGRDLIVETLSSLIDHDGEAWAIQGIARDITQRKQAETKLELAYQKQKELNEMRNRFMSMVSHDFRTPLAIMQSSLGILKKYRSQLSEERQLKHLDTIQAQTKRQLELLDDLLSLSRAESSHVKTNMKHMDWVTFTLSLLDEFQSTDETEHHFMFSRVGDWPMAQADERLMHRAVANLLSNAIKYSPEGSTIFIDLVCDEREIVLRIQDEGRGIPEDDLSHLFEPYYRAKNVGKVEGTGLGLAVVKQIVEAHGGMITVQSQPDIGTIFTLIFPKFEQ